MKKFLCKIFGHCWYTSRESLGLVWCARCGHSENNTSLWMSILAPKEAPQSQSTQHQSNMMQMQDGRPLQAPLVEEVASWKALVQHKCGVVRGMVKFYKLAREENAAQAEQIKRLEAVVEAVKEERRMKSMAEQYAMMDTRAFHKPVDDALKEASK